MMTLLYIAFIVLVVTNVWFYWREDKRKAERHVTERAIQDAQLELIYSTSSFKIGNREYMVHQGGKS